MMNSQYKPARSKELPKTHMMNPARVWIPSAQTDIAATFARIRAEQHKPEKIKRIK